MAILHHFEDFDYFVIQGELEIYYYEQQNINIFINYNHRGNRGRWRFLWRNKI